MNCRLNDTEKHVSALQDRIIVMAITQNSKKKSKLKIWKPSKRSLK